MSIPFLQVRPNAIKLKVIPKIPADFHDGVGTQVNKAESVFSIDLDYADFPPYPPPPIDNNQQVLLWDQSRNTYSLIPAHYLGGDIWVDAPNDGHTYGRLNGAWSQTLDLTNGGVVVGNVTLNGTNTVGGATSFTSSLSASGTATFTGTIAVPTPTLGGQATNKTYVDTQIASGVSGAASNATPLMDGSAAAGVSALYSRGDHVHPTDTTRAPLASPGLTGTPTAPTAPVNTNTTQLATTQFVLGQAATVAPLMDSAAAVGVSLLYARQDHVHPTDTSRAPTANPTFTGAVNVTGTFELSGIISPTALSASQNNYNPTGLNQNTILRLTATGPVNITGLAAQPAGTVVALTNIGTNAITLTNLDAGSLAANQFNLGANTALAAGQTALLFYDGTASQWRNLAGSGSGGGGGAAVYIQDTAPSGVAAGSLWWQSSTGTLFIFYNDGNSSQFVAVSSGGGGGGGGIPSGTVMLFYQAAAPTGWTQVTTHNDKALRVVSGTGGGSGGTNAFSTVMAQTVVGNTTLTTAQIPAHNHTIGGGAGAYHYNITGGGGAAQPGGSGGSSGPTTDNQGGGGTHNHTITMAMQYIDVIIASKN